MDDILTPLVLVIGFPLIMVFAFLLGSGYLSYFVYRVGLAIAEWVSGAPWRGPAVCILIGLIMLGAVQWAAKFHETWIFLVALLVLFYFLKGLSGFDDDIVSDRDPRPDNRLWWR